jgi:predicted N-acetyltransferase YhbS
VLTLGPCAVLPAYQRQGAGSAAIRAGLDAARRLGENLILVLGHPDYYPRFGFASASRWGVHPPFEAPDGAMMALMLDPARSVPSGVIRYPAAFGV